MACLAQGEADLLLWLHTIAAAPLFLHNHKESGFFFSLIQYSPPSLSLNVSFCINLPSFPQTNSNVVLEMLILQVSLPVCCEIAIK